MKKYICAITLVLLLFPAFTAVASGAEAGNQAFRATRTSVYR